MWENKLGNIQAFKEALRGKLYRILIRGEGINTSVYFYSPNRGGKNHTDISVKSATAVLME